MCKQLFFLFFLIASPLFSEEISIEMIDLETGHSIYKKESSALHINAEKVLLCTATAALHTLGVEDCFKTSLYYEGELYKGVLKGTLFLKGSGDPTFQMKDLHELAALLNAAGVSRIEGDLCVDDQIFISDREETQLDNQKDAEGFNINHNEVHLSFLPCEETPEKPPVCMDLPSLQIRKQKKREGQTEDVQFDWQRNSLGLELVIRGTIHPKEGSSVRIPLQNPALFAGYCFRDLLKKKGITMMGRVCLRSTSSSAHLLVTHKSTPLADHLFSLLNGSDLLMQSALNKRVGAKHFDSQGSSEKGEKALTSFFQDQLGIVKPPMMVIDSGSLSYESLTTANELCTLLRWVYKKSGFFYELQSAMDRKMVEGAWIRECHQDLGLAQLYCGYLKTPEGKQCAYAALFKRSSYNRKLYEQMLKEMIGEIN